MSKCHHRGGHGGGAAYSHHSDSHLCTDKGTVGHSYELMNNFKCRTLVLNALFVFFFQTTQKKLKKKN